MSKPRIISLRHSKDPRSGVVLYAKVQSRTSPSTQHIVTGSRRGDGLIFRCSCESRMFRPRTKCDHIKAVQERESRL